MDAAYTDKLDGKIPEDFWERKMSEWRVEEQQVKMAIDGLTSAENGGPSPRSQRSVRTRE
jgi:catechol-2,3-dioxygenase